MMPRVLRILAAQRIGQYPIHLQFDDGAEQVIDFQPFLTRSLHSDIRRGLDRPDRFAPGRHLGCDVFCCTETAGFRWKAGA